MTLFDFLARHRAGRRQRLPPVVLGASNNPAGVDDLPQPEPGGATELATLGAGCFWCLDAIARRTTGITSSVVGYAGGSTAPPSYEQSHDPAFAHVEAVQLVFEPAVTTFRAILDLFFRSHDPTVANRDGANRGSEYHSTIFYHSDQQRDIAEAATNYCEGLLGRPIRTSIRPFTTFFPAELEHQDFFGANPTHPYCTFVVIPKLEKALRGP